MRTRLFRRQRLDGHVDRVRADVVEGWLRDRLAPRKRRCLEVWANGRLVAVAVANRYRADLDAAGLGDGACGFVVPLPQPVSDLAHLCVRDAETGWVLSGAGRDPFMGLATVLADEAAAAETFAGHVGRHLDEIAAVRRRNAAALRQGVADYGVPPLPVPPAAAAAALPDVVFLPPIDWFYRHQRPQHLATELARRGHRVFYLATDFNHEGPAAAVYAEPSPGVRLVRLRARLPHPVINRDPAAGPVRDDLVSALGALEREWRLRAPVYVVGAPFWYDVLPMGNHGVVYDCMDLSTGFSATTSGLAEAEARLVAAADVVVASSRLLAEDLAAERPGVPLFVIPNAAADSFFDVPPLPREPRACIGYVGAIEEWFDGELVLSLARRNPAWRFDLIGNVGPSQHRLGKTAPSNLRLHGERPFSEIAALLAGIDVAIIPFKDTALTRYTNPVKVYEYLAAGRPVVASPLPEMDSFDAEVVAQCTTVESFEQAILAAMRRRSPTDDIRRRMRVIGETWDARAATFAAIVRAVSK